ncbi:MAG: hypothetical protein GY710_13360 [Desulfobacteraceae bacterium]|nr:hypothetical protein [Desulfobacteraceae bacterium]
MEIETKITKIIQGLNAGTDPLVVSMCGAADLGKSFLSDKIARQLNNMGISTGHLTLDSFLMKREERIKKGISGYQPDAYDLKSIENHITNFKNQKSIKFFPYDHSSGEKSQEKITIGSCKVLIVDGLHSMHKKIRKNTSLSLFVYTDDDKLRKIRLKADIFKRKQTVELSKKLEPVEFEKYKNFVEPYKKQADFLLNLKEKWRYELERGG